MLTLKYVSKSKLDSMESIERVNYIINILKIGDIILLDSKLNVKDEALLIRETMSNIDESFNGIEIGVLNDSSNKTFFSKLRHWISKKLIGDTSGITLIGPAKIIGELRSHPEMMELHLSTTYLSKHLSVRKQNVSK